MSFNQLPLEIQAEILKLSNYQRCIKKSLNQYNLSLFRENIGNRPISKKEFLNYFNQYKPDNFIIFQNNSVDVFRKMNDCYNLYCLDLWDCRVQLTLVNSKYIVHNMEILIRQMGDIYYDLFTTFHIIENRNIDKEYILNQFMNYSTIPDITNIESLRVFGNAYLYVDMNLKMLDTSFDVENYDITINIKDVKSEILYYNEMKQLLENRIKF